MLNWKSCVTGYMERGVTWTIEGVNETFGPDSTSHLTWGILFVEFSEMNSTLFSAFTSKYDVVDTIDERTIAIKLFEKHAFINPGCTPAVYSQAEVLTPPTGTWWHLPSMAHRNIAYPICDLLHSKYNAKLYWVIDIYPLKLAAVMKLEDFNHLAAVQRPHEYGHLDTKKKSQEREASPKRKTDE